MKEATIIIAAWSAEAFIAKSIRSALAQEGVTVDVVVIDDASPDGTGDAVAEFPQVAYARLPVNSGPSAARNRAFALASSSWVAVLDSDDTLHPEYLRTLIDLAEETDADIVLGNLLPVNAEGKPLPGTKPWVSNSDVPIGRPLSVAEYLTANQFRSASPEIGYLKPLFRKATLERLGLRYDETLRNSEDLHIVLRGLAQGARVVVSDEPGYFYTQRSGSISHKVPPEVFRALLFAERAFAAEFGANFNAETLGLLKARRVAIQGLIEGETVMRCIKSRRLSEAAGHLARRPRMIPIVARLLLEAAGKRLRA